MATTNLVLLLGPELGPQTCKLGLRPKGGCGFVLVSVSSHPPLLPSVGPPIALELIEVSKQGLFIHGIRAKDNQCVGPTKGQWGDLFDCASFVFIFQKLLCAKTLSFLLVMYSLARSVTHDEYLIEVSSNGAIWTRNALNLFNK